MKMKMLKYVARLFALAGLFMTVSCKSTPEVVGPPTLAELKNRCEALRYCQWKATDELTGCFVNQAYLKAYSACRTGDFLCLETLKKNWDTNEIEGTITPKCQAHDPVKNNISS